MRETGNVFTRTGKNNRFPFLDIFGYLKNTHKNPKFGKVRQVPTREFPTKFSLFQIWDFCGFSLNTQKYPKMGIRYFFLCSISKLSSSKEILILIYSDTLCEINLLMFFNYLEESSVVILDSVSSFRIPDFTTGSRSFPVLLGVSVDAHNTSKWRFQLKGCAEETISTL